MFLRIAVANRGEIAARIIRACRDLGIRSVLLCAEVDRPSLAAKLADEVVLMRDLGPREAYLDVERVVDAARSAGADALHAGYGFLSENPRLASACLQAGICFIGPGSAQIAMLGNKNQARTRMAESGVPIVPGTASPVRTVQEALQQAPAIGYPLLVKASMGGGGRGMRRVNSAAELHDAYGSAQSEAATAFGSGDIYLERYLERPRHIEIQVALDRHGRGVYLFERECSIQRRFQKMIEEAPSTAVTPQLRRAMGEAAVRGAQAIGYENLGTFEFLLDASGNFFFLEVNTRLQVEHPVTEEVTGIDLVCLQIALAAGQPLPFTQDDLCLRGWAFEARITCEDPLRGFLPEPGKIEEIWFPQGPGVRLDSSVYAGIVVPPHYDSLLAKLIVSGATREEARRRMLRALHETRFRGVHTTVPFHQWAFSRPAFAAGDLTTHFIEEQGWAQYAKSSLSQDAARHHLAAALAAVEVHRSQGQQSQQEPAAAADEAALRWRQAGRTYG